MPTEKDFKRLVRLRMADTGECFTVARGALATGSSPTSDASFSPRALPKDERWIELLGDAQQNEGAFGLLKELPAEDLRRLAIGGTRHNNPRVRRRSCQLLDDLSLTPETIRALESCAADPEPRVRAAALHTLSCEHCKPDGVCLDQRAIAERAAIDRSATVRRGVAMGLSWNSKHSDDWAKALATQFLSDPSAEIRRYAQSALDRIERQRRSDEDRRKLPQPLRRTTERHPGKWVAIVDRSIVAVNPSSTWKRRRRDAQLYFVVPEEDTTSRA